MSTTSARCLRLAALGLVACRDRSTLARPAPVAQVDAAATVDAAAVDGAPPPVVEGYREADVVAAKGATVGGSIGSVDAAAGRVTVAWAGTKGLLVHCVDETIDREHEGKVSRTTCRTAEIAADGALGPLVARVPDDAWLEEAIPAWRARRAAAPSAEAVLAKETSFSQYAVPLLTGSAPALAVVSEEISGGAVGGCAKSASRVDGATALGSCEIWQPSVTAAWRGNRSAVLLAGIEGETFARLYERYQGGSSAPWAASLRARLVHRTGQGEWQRAAVPFASDVEALAVHSDRYGIVWRGSKSMPWHAPEAATVRASVRPWPPTEADVPPIVIARGGNAGGATGAFTANGELVVVWENPGAKRLEAVALTPGPATKKLRSLAAGGAPSMASAGDTLALAFVDATGAGQIACGALGATPARVSEKGAAPRVALAPDGSGGVVVWREGPKLLRSRTFRCY